MRRFFRFYFWILLLLYFFGVFLTIGDGEDPTYEDVFDLLFSLVSLVGIFGYAYSKIIFKKVFWKIYLPVVVLWDGYYLIDFLAGDESIWSEESGLFLFLVTPLIYLVLFVPCYVAIYLYCHEKHT